MSIQNLQFIEEANILHSNFYDYSKTQYIRQKLPVINTCPDHGDFEITPMQHLNGKGCIECYKEKRKAACIKKYNDKYDYSETDFSICMLTVVCPEHGAFKVDVNLHIEGKGCKLCKHTNAINFISIAQKKYPGMFEYLDIPKTMNDVIGIKCKKHDHVFKESPNQHFNNLHHCVFCKKDEIDEYFKSLIDNDFDVVSYDEDFNNIKMKCRTCGNEINFTLTNFKLHRKKVLCQAHRKKVKKKVSYNKKAMDYLIGRYA